MSESKKQSDTFHQNTLQSHTLQFLHTADYMVSEGKLLTIDQLSRITISVAESGNLRDQALLSLITSGLHPEVLLPIKVRHVIYKTTGDRKIEIKIQNARNNNASKHTTIKNGSTIYEYIRASKLSQDDYLFASDKDAEKPMTLATLSQICIHWARVAGVDPSLGRPSTIRYSAMLEKFRHYANKYNFQVTALYLKLGHNSRAASAAYINPKDIKNS